MFGRLIFFFVLLLFIMPSKAQNISQADRDLSISLIENRLANLIEIENLSEKDAETILHQSIELIDNPLDINSLRQEDLDKIYFLSQYQKRSFFVYRASMKDDFHSTNELKMIPSWDEKTLDIVYPFFTCKSKDSKSHSIRDIIADSRYQSELISKYSQKGYSNTLDIERATALSLSMKAKNYKYYNLNLSIDKDRGEAFNNLYGDSFNFSLKINPQKSNWSLIIGDYRSSWAQGLVLSNNYNIHSLYSLNLKNSPQSSRIVSGFTETKFLRGISFDYNKDRYSLSAIFSLRHIDGSISKNTINTFVDNALHRDERDIYRKQNIPIRLFALQGYYKKEKFQIGIRNVYYDWGGLTAKKLPYASEMETLKGLDYINISSFDYYFDNFRNLKSQGEFAIMQNKAIALSNSIVYTNENLSDIYLDYAYCSPNFWSYLSNSIGRSAVANNERYISLAIKPHLKKSNLNLIIKMEDSKRITELSRKNAINHIQNYASIIEWRKNIWNIRVNLLYQNLFDLSYKWRISTKIGIRLSKQSSYNLSISKNSRGIENTKQGGYLIALDGSNIIKNKLKIKYYIAYFDTDSFQNRIYYYQHRVKWDYDSNLLYGKGMLIGAKLSYQASSNFNIESAFSYEKNILVDKRNHPYFSIYLKYQF